MNLRVAALLIVPCLAAVSTEAAPIVTHRLIESGSATFVQNGQSWLHGSFSVAGPGFTFTGAGITRSFGQHLGITSLSELQGTLLLDGQQRDYTIFGENAWAGLDFIYYELNPIEPAPGVIAESHSRFEAIAYMFDPTQPGGLFDFSAYGAGTATIRYMAEGGGGHVRYVDARFDFQPVPEPTTMVSMGLGLALLAGLRSWSRGSK
jgi:hypothetical protein